MTLVRFWQSMASIMGLLVVSALSWADSDPPGRVGRVSDLAGQLYLVGDDDRHTWETIGLNYTITTGDNLWLSPNGRTEVDYGSGQIRIAGGTNLHISELDDRALSLYVAEGRISVRVRYLDAGEKVIIQTRNNVVVEFRRPGSYRVDVTPETMTTAVVVREGEAVLRLARDHQLLTRGQTANVSGHNAHFVSMRNGHGTDGFDSWVLSRERRYEESRAHAYVSDQMIGYRELDDYGSWETDATYGAVWYPTSVSIGWAPYRHGHWRWVRPWGWTWIDDAPWGFAPTHYGRWVWLHNRWGWCPGRWIARPVYAPALVTFYGGSGWSVSIGTPVYGWAPLGWGDPYWPSHRYSHAYWRTINRPYVPRLPERPTRPRGTINANVPGAITAVPSAVFTAARPVAPHLVNVPAYAAREAPVITETIQAVKPTSRAELSRQLAGSLPQPASVLRKPQALSQPEPTAAPSVSEGKPGGRAILRDENALRATPAPSANPPQSMGVPAAPAVRQRPHVVTPAPIPSDSPNAIVAPPPTVAVPPSTAAPSAPPVERGQRVVPPQRLPQRPGNEAFPVQPHRPVEPRVVAPSVPAAPPPVVVPPSVEQRPRRIEQRAVEPSSQPPVQQENRRIDLTPSPAPQERAIERGTKPHVLQR